MKAFLTLKEMLDKSLPEQITMLKTYINNSINQSSKHQGGIIQRYKFERIVEGLSFCREDLFGITCYLRKPLTITYCYKEGKNLNTIDEETAKSIENSCTRTRFWFRIPMKPNFRIPDSEGIGHVRLCYVISTYLLVWKNCIMMYHKEKL